MTLGDRDRRAIVLGLAVVVPALLFVWVIRPFFGADADRRAQVAAARTALARERGLLAQADLGPVVVTAADSVRQAAARWLIDAPDDAIAGERLTSYVAGVARRNNVLMLEAAGRHVTSSGSGVRTIQVEVRAESDFQGIVGFLRALEDGDKLVRLASVTLTPGSGMEEEEAGIVRLRATIEGFAVTAVRRPAPVSARRASPDSVRAGGGEGMR